MTFTSWNDYLCHYQIKGAKHGIRRFQNYDGSLTPAGRLRYLKGDWLNKRGMRQISKLLKSTDEESRKAAVALTNSLFKNDKVSDSPEKTVYTDNSQETKGFAKLGLKRAIKTQARKMSDERLKNAVSRLELEKKYTDLQKEQNKGLISTGAEVVGSMFRKSIENIGTQTLTYALGKAINKVSGQDLVNPKKGQKDK